MSRPSRAGRASCDGTDAAPSAPGRPARHGNRNGCVCPEPAVIGFLSLRTPEQARILLDAFHAGLRQEGFIDGDNVVIDYRWGNGNLAALPNLAADLVVRNVAVIVAGGTPQPTRDATSTIPVVFTIGLDPIAYGLVTSINRPTGNLTGATFYAGALGGKQLELLRELAPKAGTFGLLVKPDSPAARPQIEAMGAAAKAVGIEIQVLKAAVKADFEPVIAAFAQQPGAALIVSRSLFRQSCRARGRGGQPACTASDV